MPLTQIKTSNIDNTGSGLNFRNRIINGAMQIDQRNAGAAVTSTAYWPVDRFNLSMGAGTFTGQQVADAPEGFAYSLKLIQASYGSASYKLLQQYVEGYNITDLNWGTAKAKNVTVSFWVKGSVTGTYTLTLQNAASGSGRWAYVTTYTINSANTWEYKTITITAPTTATWTSNNTRGIGILFDLGSTGYVTSTLNSWQNNNVFYASGAVDLSNNSGASWQVTGVQLEEGSAATAFENRPYGTELQLCQRYCWSSYTASGNGGPLGTGAVYNSTLTQVALHLPVSMRTTPSATTVANGSSIWCQSYVGATGTSTNLAPSIQSDSYNYQNLRIAIDGLSGMTAGQSSWTFTAGGAKLILSAEL